MSEPKPTRRTFVTRAAALPAAAALATAEASAAPRDAAGGKQVVTIGADNAVYGASASAFDKYGYSPAVRAGGLLFMAGVVGFRADGTLPESAAEQGELAFRRIAEILRLEGLGMEDLVEVVSYHVDLPANLAAFMPVKERHFKRPFPAWTILGVAALALPELKIEIRCTAALRR